MAGPVIHTGIGLPEGPIHGRFGYRYNYRNPEGGAWLISDANIHGSETSEYYLGVHGSVSETENHKHACYALFPPLLNQEGVHGNWIHDFDVEAGFVAILGLTAGFSLGEFLDFLLGWFGVDIVGDDDAGVREKRDYFRDRAGHPGPILPKKDGS
jgi:hypothetical protein